MSYHANRQTDRQTDKQTTPGKRIPVILGRGNAEVTRDGTSERSDTLCRRPSLCEMMVQYNSGRISDGVSRPPPDSSRTLCRASCPLPVVRTTGRAVIISILHARTHACLIYQLALREQAGEALSLCLLSPPGSCASGCVVECRICNWEVAGSNLSLGYFAPRFTQPSIPPGSVNEYQL